jgi:hypothetical protein
MPRRAHPGASIDAFIARAKEVGLVPAPTWTEIAEVVVDGKRFGEITDTLYSDRRFEIRPEKKHRETFALAAAVVLSGRRGAIETIWPNGTNRDRPDLSLRTDICEVGVEVTRVEPNARWRSTAMELERKLNEALNDDDLLRPRGLIARFEIAADTLASTPLTPTEIESLFRDLRGFFERRIFELVPAGASPAEIFPADSVAGKLGITVQIATAPSGYGVQVRLADAGGEDVEDMTAEIVGAINRKANDARSYLFVGPLWLVVEVTEQPGRFKESMRSTLTHPELRLEPFERVLIHDGLDLFEIARHEKGGD